MTTQARRGLLAVVVAIALIAVGAGIAVVLSAGATSARAASSSVADGHGIASDGDGIVAWLGYVASADVAGTGSDPAGDSFSSPTGIVPEPVDERDLEMAWLARGLLVLAVAWVVIGLLSARTSLVRRPGAAAARATWLGSTRPWRARESTLGMLPLDRWLLFSVPVALLVATRLVQTSFFGWVHVAVVIGAWTVFALVLRLGVAGRSPWPVMAAVGGVVTLRCIVTLIGLSFSGPGGSWSVFWSTPSLRALYIAIAFALFVWVFVAAGWSVSVQLGARRATGCVFAAVGAGLAVPAVVVGIVGLRHALTVWHAQLEPLSWGLAQLLDIPGALAVPDALAWWVAGVGAVIAVVGGFLALPARERVVSL